MCYYCVTVTAARAIAQIGCSTLNKQLAMFAQYQIAAGLTMLPEQSMQIRVT